MTGLVLPGRPDPFATALDKLYPPDAATIPFYNDPAGWARTYIKWPKSPSGTRGLTGYQEEILTALVEHGRASARGPHGLGKTTLSAVAVGWFATTRDQAKADWKIITTASVWRQLQLYLWPEVHKWVRLIDWPALGVPSWREGAELLDLAVKLGTGQASAVASDDPTAIEGAHADELLYLFDESKAIKDATFDAAEGAFSTAGDDGTNAYALAVSTPGEPQGRFYDIHARKAGTEDWWVKHVTLAEAIEAGRVTTDWVERRAALWGRTSATYKNRVEGEFAASDSDGVIPLAWVELANDRWREMFGKGDPVDAMLGTARVVTDGMPLTVLGVDVAREGNDLSVIALANGHTVLELRRYPYTNDTMELTGHVLGLQENHPTEDGKKPRAAVDVIGVGGGVVDRLREEEAPVTPFNASEGTPKKDASGELGFVNKRSAAWWNLRELLDPANGNEPALPPDDRLTGDLVAPKWKVMSGGKIQVEAKADIKKRIGRSTDDGDSVVMALWDEPPGIGAAFLAAWKAQVPASKAKGVEKALAGTRTVGAVKRKAKCAHRWGQFGCVLCGEPEPS